MIDKLKQLQNALNRTVGQHSLNILVHLGQESGTAKFQLNYKCVIGEIDFSSLEELWEKILKVMDEEGVDYRYGSWDATWITVNKHGGRVGNKKAESVTGYRFQLEDIIFDKNFGEEEDINWFEDIKILECALTGEEQ